MQPLVVPEVHDELIDLADIQCKAVFLAPSREQGQLISVLHFVVIAYQTNNCGVVCLYDSVAAMYGLTVVGPTVNYYLIVAYLMPQCHMPQMSLCSGLLKGTGTFVVKCLFNSNVWKIADRADINCQHTSDS